MYSYKLLLFALLSIGFIKGQNGFIRSFIEDGMLQKTCYVRWLGNELQYTPGGVTFTYPVDFFADTPHVYVSVRKDALTSNTLVTPIITSSDAASVTILVTIGTGDPVIITEADDTYCVAIYVLSQESACFN